MARHKSQTSSSVYFKPDVSVDYKPTKGTFSIYDFATKESVEVPSVTFLSVVNLRKFESDGFTSARFESLFKDPIKIFETDPWKYAGTFKYRKDVGLVDERGNEAGYEGKTTLCSVGVLEDGRSCEINIKGFAKMDLEKKNEDGTNVQKIKDFNDLEYITLSSVSDSVRVGKKKSAQKDIFLLDVKDGGKFDDSLDKKADEIWNLVESELESLRNGSVQESDENRAEKKRVIDEPLSMDDIPF